MRKTRILFINTEVEPYMPSGHLADLGRRLPQTLQDLGHEARIFTPRFRIINERRNQLHEVIRLSGQNIIINETDHALMLKVASLLPQRIQIYFIDNEEYFVSRGVYTDKNGHEYADQVERCLFFARGVAETMRRLRWSPDIIYCQGWFAALVPMILRKTMNDIPAIKKSKIILAVFDNAFKEPWPETTSKTIKVNGVTKIDIAEIKERPLDHTDICKFALKYCDGLILTDPNIDPAIRQYAEEAEKPILDLSEATEYDPTPYDVYFESFYPRDPNAPVEEDVVIDKRRRFPIYPSY